ncbi:thyrotropin-releasing hormone receptor-like [Pecten maximus]|uniref:thyrotropin-releasing hormone receptor-like n=1 Tax=Pecten maximus TaxID=6579 RepID=UPI0014581736|nr:thyrotropin-releasing hormone receptor-like [Pecten maximus]
MSTVLIGSEDYSPLYKIIAVIVPLVIFMIGILGNLLVIVVISRRRSMQTPTNCYLISLSVADCLLLLSATLPSIPEPLFRRNHWPWGRAMCSLLVFVQYLGADASALSITAFTLERYIAICHPMKAQTICTARRAKRIIISLWCFSVLYCTPWLGLTTMTYKNTCDGSPPLHTCTYRLERESYLFYYMTDFFIFYVFPLLLSGILYSFIIRILFNKSALDSDGSKAPDYSNRSRQTSKSRFQVIRMLVVIVAVFALLWLPYRAIVVYNSLADNKYLNVWFWLFCRIMVYINSAVNPILYSLMSLKFRKAYRRILSCNPHFQRQSSGTINESTTAGISRRRSHFEHTYLMAKDTRRFNTDIEKGSPLSGPQSRLSLHSLYVQNNFCST